MAPAGAANPRARCPIGLQLSPWMAPSVAGLLLATLLAVFAWRRRDVPGGVMLFLVALAVGWWSLFEILGLAATVVPAKVFYAKLRYVGVVATPVLWLYFALDHVGRGAALRRWRTHLVALPAVATLALVVSNEFHGLVWSGTRILSIEGFRVLRFEYGPWLDVYRWYGYGLVAAGVVLLGRYLLRAGSAPVAVLTVLVPAAAVAANALHVSPLGDPLWVDPTPAAAALAATFIGWGLLRAGFLDFPRIARTAVMEALQDGVVVVDPARRIMDLNRVAEELLGRSRGESLPDGFGLGSDETGPEVVTGEVDGRDRVYEVVPNPLQGSEGMVLVLRDVTERHRMEGRLRETTAALARANAELEEMAHTDPLTGLGNRRDFMRSLRQEVERTNRYGRTVALVLLDLDHFKKVNDRYGHPTGDAVLETVGRVIDSHLRDADFAGRVGGEEFGIILPETDLDGARELAERLRVGIAEECHEASRDGEETTFHVTASLGITAAEPPVPDTDVLFAQADRALYRAKEGGRNRVAT